MEDLLRSKKISGTGLQRYSRSGSLQEVVSNKPPFLVRWSNLFFLLIFILIGFVGWFVRYPELIEIRGEVVSRSSKDQMAVIRLIGVDTTTSRLILNQKASVEIYSPAHRDSTSTTGVIENGMIIRLNENEFHFIAGRVYDLKLRTEKISLLERIYIRLLF